MPALENRHDQTKEVKGIAHKIFDVAIIPNKPTILVGAERLRQKLDRDRVRTR